MPLIVPHPTIAGTYIVKTTPSEPVITGSIGVTVTLSANRIRGTVATPGTISVSVTTSVAVTSVVPSISPSDSEITVSAVTGSGTQWSFTITAAKTGATSNLRTVSVNVTDSLGTHTGVGAAGFTVNNAPPPAPTGVVASPITRGVALSWTLSSSTYVNRYNIYYNTAATPADGSVKTLLGSTFGSSYTDSPLVANTQRWYWVTAVDDVGNESAVSSQVNATAQGDIQMTLTLDKNRVGGSATVNAALHTSAPIQASWLQLSASPTDSNITFGSIVTTDTQNYTFTVTVNKTAPLEIVTRSIIAQLNTALSGGQSGAASALLIVKTSLPGTVTGVTVSPKVQSARVTWAATGDTDLARYEVYRTLTNSAPTLGTPYGTTVDTAFLDSVLVSNTLYYYWVRAVDQTGNFGALSASGSGTTLQIIGTDIQNLAIGTGLLADTAVTTGKLFDGAVVTAKLGDLQVTLAKIADKIIDNTKLVDYTIGNLQLALNAVQSGNLLDGAVLTNKIAANAVVVSKLTVTDFTNLAENPGFEIALPVGWTADARWTFVTPSGTAYAGTKVAQLAPGGAGVWATLVNNNIVACAPTTVPTVPPTVAPQSFYAEVQVLRTGLTNGSIQLYFSFVDKTGAEISTPMATALTDTIAVNTWTPMSLTADAPVNTAGVRVVVRGQSTAALWQADNVIMRRRNAGELLVDGSIGANQIAANAIVAGKINALAVTFGTIDAGAVRAAEIHAGAITANHIVAMGLDASVITAGTITTDRMTAGTINADRLVAASITADKLASRLITATKLGIVSAVVEAGAFTNNSPSAGYVSWAGLRIGTNGTFYPNNADLTQTFAGSTNLPYIWFDQSANTVRGSNRATAGGATPPATGTLDGDFDPANDVLLGFNNNGIFQFYWNGTLIKGDQIVTGTITAKHIGVNTLAALTADIGVITAGRLQDALDASSTRGIRLTRVGLDGTTYGKPSGWSAGYFLDLAANTANLGEDMFLQAADVLQISLGNTASGTGPSAAFKGNVTALTLGVTGATTFTGSVTASSGIQARTLDIQPSTGGGSNTGYTNPLYARFSFSGDAFKALQEESATFTLTGPNTTTQITDTNRTFTPDALADGETQIIFRSGVASGLSRTITACTATTISFAAVPTAPAAGDTYVIQNRKSVFIGKYGAQGSGSSTTTPSDNSWSPATQTKTVPRGNTASTLTNIATGNLLSTGAAASNGVYHASFTIDINMSGVDMTAASAGSYQTVTVTTEVWAAVNGAAYAKIDSRSLQNTTSAGSTGTDVSAPFTVDVTAAPTTSLTLQLRTTVVGSSIYGPITGTTPVTVTGGPTTWQVVSSASGVSTRRSLRLFAHDNGGSSAFAPHMALAPYPVAPPDNYGREGDFVYVGGATKALYYHNGTNWVVTGTGTVAGSVAWSAITSKPTTLSGFGITDAYTQAQSDARYPSLTGAGASGTWSINITGNAGGNVTGTAGSVSGWSNPPTASTGGTWPQLAGVKSDGSMEIGRYIDFHNTSADGIDYAVRLETGGTSSGLTINSSQILTAANFNSYAPTLTGTGASGTWGITVGTPAQPNITSLGTLTALTVSGTITLPSRSIADAALSTNVPLLNAANVFTADQQVGSSAAEKNLTLAGSASTSAVLRATAWGNGAYFASNLTYSGTGDPTTNVTYTAGPGGSNTGGLMFRLDGNSKRFAFYTAPTSTLAGDPATLTARLVIDTNAVNVSSVPLQMNGVVVLDTSRNATLGTITGTGNVSIDGGAGAGRRVTLTHNTNIADGLALIQTTASAPTPRLFFQDTTGSVAVYGSSGALGINTGATLGSSSGTSRLLLTATLLDLQNGVGLSIAGTTVINSARAATFTTLIAGANAPVSTALVSSVGPNGFEFGNNNASGYRGVLGAESSSGQNFLAFHAEAGTNANTYRTRGVKGSVVRSDAAGGFYFGSVATASADNQTLTTLATLNSSGNFIATSLRAQSGTEGDLIMEKTGSNAYVTYFYNNGINTGLYDATVGGSIWAYAHNASIAAGTLTIYPKLQTMVALAVGGDISLTTNAKVFGGKTSGGLSVILFNVASDDVFRFRAAVDTTGFAWSDQAAAGNWMLLNSTQLTIGKPVSITGGDLTIGSLGAFNSSLTPANGNVLVYDTTNSKWNPRNVQFTLGTSDTKVTLGTDTTAYSYIYDATAAAAGVGTPSTPTAGPVLTAGHKAITVDFSAYANVTGGVTVGSYEIDYATNSGFTGAVTVAATSMKLVHSLLTSGTTYYYRFRAKGASLSGNSPVTSLSAINNSAASAFGSIIASEIAVVSLSAIKADLGTINAGLILNNGATPTAALRLSSGYVLPTSVTTYIDLAFNQGGGTGPFIQSAPLSVDATSATIRGTVTATSILFGRGGAYFGSNASATGQNDYTLLNYGSSVTVDGTVRSAGLLIQRDITTGTSAAWDDVQTRRIAIRDSYTGIQLLDTPVIATATSGTPTSITDSARVWGVDQFRGLKVRVLNGSGVLQFTADITGNTATTVSYATQAVTPVAGWTFQIQNVANAQMGSYILAASDSAIQYGATWAPATTSNGGAASVSSNTSMTAAVNSQFSFAYTLLLDGTGLTAGAQYKTGSVTGNVTASLYTSLDNVTYSATPVFTRTMSQTITSDGTATVTGTQDTQSFTDTVYISGYTTTLYLKWVVTTSQSGRTGLAGGSAAGTLTPGSYNWTKPGTGDSVRRNLRLFSFDSSGTFNPAMTIEPVSALPDPTRARRGDIIFVAGSLNQLYFHDGGNWQSTKASAPGTHGYGSHTYDLIPQSVPSTPSVQAAWTWWNTSAGRFEAGTAAATVKQFAWVGDSILSANVSAGTFTGAFTFSSTITGSITGNAGTATKLAAAVNINGVAFDGSAAITVTAAAGTLTGTTLAAGITASSLTSVGTLTGLSVTATISGSITGNAGTATTLQNSRNINGVLFNGSADITVTAAAGTLTGATLAAGITASSLTSVGTLANLAVLGKITAGNSGAVGLQSHDFVSGSVTARLSADGSLGAVYFGSVANHPIIINYNSAEVARFNASGIVGTIATASQPNITAVGTLVNLTTAGDIMLKNHGASQRYIFTDEDSTGTSLLYIQAGAGSAGYGGSVSLYAAAHATKPGYVEVGLGSTAARKFQVATLGIGNGSVVFSVDQGGNGQFSGTLGVTGGITGYSTTSQADALYARLALANTIEGNLFANLPSVGPSFITSNPELQRSNIGYSAIATGRPLYYDEEFALGLNGVVVYNNGTGGITITRNTDASAPNASGYSLTIAYDGTGAPAPGLGGFIQQYIARRNAIIVQRFRAKIPVSYSVNYASNSQGTNANEYWITPTVGTGKWQEYIRVVVCGNTGSFASGGHVYLTGPAGAVTWYLASCNAYEPQNVGSLNANGVNGLALGNISGRRRIMYGSAGATAFSLLTDADVYADLYGNTAVFNTLTGTISTAAQPNITSLGTLSSLGVSGAITAGTNVSGGGGIYYTKDDTGTLRWAHGTLGSAAAKDWQLYDVVNSASRIIVSATTGLALFSNDVTVNGSLQATNASSLVTTANNLTNFINQSGTRSNFDFNAQIQTGFYNYDSAPTNGPGTAYAQLIVAKGNDTGLQITGGYTNGDLYFRGWSNSGASFTTWARIIHHLNISGYAPSLTGSGASGNWNIGSQSSKLLGLWDNSTFYQGTFTTGTRSVAQSPNAYTRSVSWEFKDTGVFNPNGGTANGNYRGLLTLAQYDGTTASTGDSSYQLVFAPAGISSTGAPTLAVRAGIDTTWGAWSTLLHSTNVGSYALPISGGTLTGVLTLPASGIAFNSLDSGMFVSNGYLYLSVRSNGRGVYVNLANGDVGMQGSLSVGGSVTATTAYYIGTNQFATVAGTYIEMFPVGSGTPAIHLGGSGDPANYYSNTQHVFRSISGTTYGTFNSTGLSVSGSVSASGIVSTAGLYDISNSGLRLTAPAGASRSSTTSSETGAIKIKLPVSRYSSTTMQLFTVKIYQYNTGNSYVFTIGGYNYTAGAWYNVTAMQQSDSGVQLTVRFGYDGTSNCVWIGETSTVWTYPQIHVTDFQGGYQYADAAWGSGWNISIVTAFDTVNVSRTASMGLNSNNVGTYALPITGGSLTGNLFVGGDITARRAATTGVVNFGDSAAYIYYNGTSFDFSGKAIGSIASVTTTGSMSAGSASITNTLSAGSASITNTLTAANLTATSAVNAATGSFSSTVQADTYTDGLSHTMAAIMVGTVAPTSQTARQGTLFVVV